MMDENKKTSSKKEILSQLIRLSLPSIMGLVVISLYGTIDSAFVGKGIGTDAVAALAVIFPFNLIILAFAQMFGIGGQSVISRALGANDKNKIKTCMTTVFYSTLFLSTTLFIVFISFDEILLKFWGASDNILRLSKEYFDTVINGTVFLMMFITLNNLIRGEGKAIRAMWTLIITALTNTILNYIFIFHLGLGMRGAALATVISQIFAFIFLLFYLLSKKTRLRIDFHKNFFDPVILSEVIKIGLSSLLRQIFTALKIIITNNLIMLTYTGIGLAAFGIIIKLQSIFLMPVYGILQGLSPVAGFSHGANRQCDVKSSISISIILSTGILIIFWMITMFFPSDILSTFTDDKEFIQRSGLFMRLFFLFLPLSGFQIIICGVLQAVGNVKMAFIGNILKDGLIPLLTLISLFMFLDHIGIWISFPVSEFISGIFIYNIFHRSFPNICTVRKEED